MASAFFVVIITVILLQIGTGKDIKWIRNSNWDNVDNWELGRLPCKGDIASFSQVKPTEGKTPIVYFNANSTIKSLILPRNTKIVLKRSVTIRLSVNESCEVDANAVPIVAGQVNHFTGVRSNKWECKDNWRAVNDNSSVDHAPCGSDVAVFPSDSAFSYVTSSPDAKVSVRSVLIRSHKPANLDDFQNEFLLDLTINTGCQDDADSCVCIATDDNCNIAPTSTVKSPPLMTSVPISTTATVPKSSATSSPGASKKSDDSNAGAVAGAVIGVIVLLIVVAVIVIIAIVIIRKRRYIIPKHEKLDEDFPPAAKESGLAAYDNPTYDVHSTDPMDQLVPDEKLDQDTHENPLYQ